MPLFRFSSVALAQCVVGPAGAELQNWPWAVRCPAGRGLMEETQEEQMHCALMALGDCTAVYFPETEFLDAELGSIRLRSGEV
jgi:hypothetical protein